MKGNVVIMGLRPTEECWVRLLVRLLRDSDPTVGELARQALEYVEGAASGSAGRAAANH